MTRHIEEVYARIAGRRPRRHRVLRGARPMGAELPRDAGPRPCRRCPASPWDRVSYSAVASTIVATRTVRRRALSLVLELGLVLHPPCHGRQSADDRAPAWSGSTRSGARPVAPCSRRTRGSPTALPARSSRCRPSSRTTCTRRGPSRSADRPHPQRRDDARRDRRRRGRSTSGWSPTSSSSRSAASCPRRASTCCSTRSSDSPMTKHRSAGGGRGPGAPSHRVLARPRSPGGARPSPCTSSACNRPRSCTASTAARARFVAPSRAEGNPLTVIEAMAHGDVHRRERHPAPPRAPRRRRPARARRRPPAPSPTRLRIVSADPNGAHALGGAARDAARGVDEYQWDGVAARTAAVLASL